MSFKIRIVSEQIGSWEKDSWLICCEHRNPVMPMSLDFKWVSLSVNRNSRSCAREQIHCECIKMLYEHRQRGEKHPDNVCSKQILGFDLILLALYILCFSYALDPQEFMKENLELVFSQWSLPWVRSRPHKGKLDLMTFSFRIYTFIQAKTIINKMTYGDVDVYVCYIVSNIILYIISTSSRHSASSPPTNMPTILMLSQWDLAQSVEVTEPEMHYGTW